VAILAISHITSDGRTDAGTDGEGSLWASRTPVAARTSDLCLQPSPIVVHTSIPVVHAKYAWRGEHVN
jgi:hypothetical protein